MSQQRELLRMGEAAESLAVSISTLRRWKRDGRLRTVRLPTGGVRVRRTDIDALLDNLEEASL